MGGTNDTQSPRIKKVGGTVSPVSPPSYAHAYIAFHSPQMISAAYRTTREELDFF